MKVTVSILSYCTGFIYYKLGHTFLSFSSSYYYCTFEIYVFTAGCLETISIVAYNISDLSNDKYPRKEVLAKNTVRHRIDSLNVRNAKNASTLHAQTLVTTNS